MTLSSYPTNFKLQGIKYINFLGFPTCNAVVKTGFDYVGKKLSLTGMNERSGVYAENTLGMFSKAVEHMSSV